MPLKIEKMCSGLFYDSSNALEQYGLIVARFDIGWLVGRVSQSYPAE